MFGVGGLGHLAIQRLGGVNQAIALAVSPRAFEQAYGSLRRGGTLVFVALTADNEVKIPIFETVLNGITIVGSIVGTRKDPSGETSWEVPTSEAVLRPSVSSQIRDLEGSMPHGTDAARWPPLEQITVGDVMHSGILSCGTGASVTEIAQAMAAEQVHCVAVMAPSHEPDEERVWGIVSDLDLMEAGFSKDPEPTAATLAHQPIVSVKPSMGIRDAAQLMHKYKVAHVVVIDPEGLAPVGILSTMDIAEVLAQQET